MRSLKKTYEARRAKTLVPVAQAIEAHLQGILSGQARIDRVSARAKSVDSFCRKAKNRHDDGTKKYTDPLNEIQDQVGARIIVFYPQDVGVVADVINEHFYAIETKELGPSSVQAFGYFGRHFILPIPSEAYPHNLQGEAPEHFELQIKTMFQHAWSESSHDLAYKPGHGKLTGEQRRMVAYAAAQAWGADRIFEDIANGRIFQNVGVVK